MDLDSNRLFRTMKLKLKEVFEQAGRAYLFQEP